MVPSVPDARMKKISNLPSEGRFVLCKVSYLISCIQRCHSSLFLKSFAIAKVPRRWCRNSHARHAFQHKVSCCAARLPNMQHSAHHPMPATRMVSLEPSEGAFMHGAAFFTMSTRLHSFAVLSSWLTRRHLDPKR
jgi:hypothetical protein